MNKLPISALVASYNEGHLLEDCLKSLQFCDEVVVVDLNSTDNTAEIARRWATTYHFEPEYVPYFDVHHHKYIPPLKHNWFILIDPDERIMPALAESIGTFLQTVAADIAAIRAPMINHFKGKALKGTTYGGIVYARLLYFKPGISIDDDVHNGIKVLPGFDKTKIWFEAENYDRHLWCNSWAQLYDKHRRYLLGEGQARYNEGRRYRFGDEWKGLVRTFYFNFKGMKGYTDGLRGLGISLMEARYEFIASRRLLKYQRAPMALSEKFKK